MENQTMQRSFLTLLAATALALPLTVNAAGLSAGGGTSASGSIGAAGTANNIGSQSPASGATGALGNSDTDLRAGTAARTDAQTGTGATGNGLSLGAGVGTRTDMGQRQQIQRDNMATRPNGSVNDPDLTANTATSTGAATSANSNAQARGTGPVNTTTLGGRANTATGIGLDNGTITGNGLSNGTVGATGVTGTTNVQNGIAATGDRNGNHVVSLNAGRIRELQTVLKSKGYYNGTVDGMLGANTAAALRRYQADNRLAVTGRTDLSTLNELGVNAGAGAAGAH
jgi:hypothetical protein